MLVNIRLVHFIVSMPYHYISFPFSKTVKENIGEVKKKILNFHNL